MVTVLVVGSTGRQGGATARQLLERGHDVTALVRRRDTAAAGALAAAGARLVEGDLLDSESVRLAAADVDAVFGLSVPFGTGGKEEEVEAGRILVDASAGAHLVYSSVRGGDRIQESRVGHAGAKQLIELYLRERGTPATVLGPAYFMDNLLGADPAGLRRGAFSLPLSPDKRLDQVAVTDIAAMAVHAIEHPDTMVGRRVDLASDSVTGTEAAGILSEVLGRDIAFEQIPIESVRAYRGEELARMWEAFEANQVYVDRLALRREYPDIPWHSYRAWADHVDWDAVLAR